MNKPNYIKENKKINYLLQFFKQSIYTIATSEKFCCCITDGFISLFQNVFKDKKKSRLISKI